MTTKRLLRLAASNRTPDSSSKLAADINPDIVRSRVLTKPLRWLGDSRRRVREFPQPARQRAGFELWEVQQGHEPSDWRSMPAVGHGVNEVRLHAESEHRVLYVAKFEEAVYVLHAFSKKTQRTLQRDIEVAGARYRALTQQRERK